MLRQVWARQFVREGGAPPGRRERAAQGQGRAAARRRSRSSRPYDPQARFRTRSGTSWTGYVVHLTETCEDDTVNLLTHAMTTVATVHEARCTAAIHQALAGKGLAPGEHLVDAAYVDAELLVRSREEHGIDLVGPPRPNPTWQGKVEGGYTIDRFEVDWDERAGALPAGQAVLGLEPAGRPGRHALRLGHGSARPTAAACPARPLCTRGQAPGPAPEAAAAGRARGAQGRPGRLATKEGRRRYARRAGIEGTISQGVRAFGLRRSRYRGLARTHLQHVATAAAINLERLARLVPGGPARRHPHLPLRRPRRLSRLRQRYPTVFGVKLVSRQYWCGAWR